MRILLKLLLLTSLTGCYCVPDHGDSINSSYFGACWQAAHGQH